MLAYAASRPAPVERRPHPNAMLAIIAAHVAVVAAVMSAKMDLPHRLFPKPTTVIFVPTPKDPPTNPQNPRTPQARSDTIDQTRPVVPTLPQGVTHSIPARLRLPIRAKSWSERRAASNCRLRTRS